MTTFYTARPTVNVQTLLATVEVWGAAPGLPDPAACFTVTERLAALAEGNVPDLIAAAQAFDWSQADLALTYHLNSQRKVTATPARPSTNHDFDFDAMAWADRRTLQDLRDAKWGGIKRKRDTLEAASFPYLDKRIDSDPRSVQRITTAVQAADAAQRAGLPFAIDWTCFDNSTLVLDGPAMQGMPVALADHANNLHQQARSLRALIEAAPDQQALDLITWETHA